MTFGVPRCLGLLALAGGISLLWAGEPAAEVPVGASKETVIAVYGKPAGQSKLGAREILNYPNGQVILEEGKVVRMELRGGAPRAVGGAAGNATSVTPNANSAPGPALVRKDGWLLDYDAAAKEAARLGQPILAWFSGSEWSPASRQFEDEVALRPGFAAALGKGFVFLRVDLPEHNADQAASHAGNFRLRERMGITVYPALLVVSATGEKLARIDTTRPRNGEAYLNRVIALVRDMNDLLGLAPLPPTSLPAETTATNRPAAAVTAQQVTARLLSAGWSLVSAVGTGVLVVAGLFWLLYRNWAGPGPSRPKPAAIAHRISEAASGLPTYDEIVTWSKERIVVVAAGLGEAQGFQAEFQRAGSDKEIVFKKSGEPGAQAYVCCAGGNAGVITVKQIRELIGMLTADGVGAGWFVAPLGFAAEARAYAEKHRVKLIDGHRLVALLHELPPVAVPSVTRQPWAKA